MTIAETPLCLRLWAVPWYSSVPALPLRPLRRRCKDLIREFKVPKPFDLGQFKRELERVRNRRIQFVPVKTTSKSPCGLWLAAGDTDYVFFEAATSPLHQVHIALHELGHMLWEHQGISPFTADYLTHAMPTLDPAAMQRVLGRTTFSASEEQEAEMFATMVGERGAITEVTHRPVEFSPDTAELLGRLAAGLSSL
jgi:hypothetical protein